jgi:G:T-mismatch repair DNA endonuclease (very short patch repair protein)
MFHKVRQPDGHQEVALRHLVQGQGGTGDETPFQEYRSSTVSSPDVVVRRFDLL